MKPAKDQSTAQPVKTVASAAIALKMVVPAAYAGKIKAPADSPPGLFSLASDTISYLTIIFWASLSFVLLFVTISM